MYSLSSVALSKLRKRLAAIFLFVVGLWVVLVGFVSYYFKSAALNSTLSISVENLANITNAGDWSLVISYLDVLKSSNFNSIIINFNGQDVAGPIASSFSVFKYCSSASSTVLKGFNLLACTDLFTRQEILLILLVIPVVVLIGAVSWYLLKHSISEMFYAVSNMILSFETNPTISSDTTFKGSVEYAHLSELVKKAVGYREELAKERAQMKITRQLAHDLRSPINSLKVIEKNLSANINHDAIQHLLGSTINRLSEMTTSTLLESSHTKLNTDYDVLELVSRVCLDIFPRETLVKELRLVNTLQMMKYSPQIPHDVFDRILQNLILNAYEAAGSNKKIEIEFLEKVSDKAALTIKDNGCGFDKKVLDGINSRVYTSTKPSGNGIGLEYVTETLSKYGASFKIVSTGEQGTKIEIKFAIRKIRTLDLSKAPTFLLNSSMRSFVSHQLTSAGSEDLRKIKIEDSLFNALTNESFVVEGKREITAHAVIGYLLEEQQND